MTEITIREFCETLYCSLTRGDAFTPRPEGDIAFVAYSVTDGVASRHRVQFAGVSDLAVRHDLSNDLWSDEDRIELSVIEVERLLSGWRVWFNPWYLHEIEFHCARISLDDTKVSGTGRWLQDELPGMF
ncbi:MAG: hypothetical protein ACREOJ_07140 [Gemmatimonadaceae bacterium]